MKFLRPILSAVVLCGLTPLGFSQLAHAVAPSQSFFAYEGRLYDNANNPLNQSGVNFVIGVYDPTGSCLLYEENQTAIDLSSANPLDQGVFSLRVGNGSRTGGDPGLLTGNVFGNFGVITGSGGCIYTPTAFDARRLRVKVDTGSGYETLSPDYNLDSAPTSAVAQSLQGKVPADFILSSGTVSQANLVTLTTGADASSLHNHDSLYVKLNSASGQNLGSGNIVTTGDLGVGTTTPSADVHVKNSAAAAVVKVEGSAATGGEVHFLAGSSTQAVIKTDASNNLNIETGGTTAVQIKSDHNVFFSGNLMTAGYVRPGNGITNFAESTLITSLVTCGAPCAGATWYNTDLRALRTWDNLVGARTLPGYADAPALADGQVLKWDDATKKWVPWTVVASDNTKLPLNGSGAMTGDLQMGANNITGVANVTATGTLTAGAASVGHISATVGQVGALTMTSGQVTAAPTAANDLVNKNYADKFMGGQTLPVPGASDDLKVVRWNDTTKMWEYFTPAAGTVTSVTAGSGLQSSGGATAPTLSVKYGTASGTVLEGNQALGGDVSGTVSATTVTKVQGVSVVSTAPTGGQVLQYNSSSTRWEPTTLATANSSTTGMLSSSDWTTFNNKQNALAYTPVNRAGDTMTGALGLPGNPSANLEAAPKQYVDTSSATAAANYLRKDGSATLTGNWNFGGHFYVGGVLTPTSPDHVANKS